MSQEERPQSRDSVARGSIAANALPRMSLTRMDTRFVDIDTLPPDKLFDLTCYVLGKPLGTRTDKDILVLEKCTSDVKFFQDLVKDNGPELHRLCCQKLDYQFSKEGEIVFNLGEVGQRFYIILKGSVGVWVNIPKPAEPGQPFEMALTEVRVMPAGLAFGELALMSNKPRAATIIAKEDTHFACLDKENFHRILKDTEERKLREQLDFFGQMKLFSGWSHNLLQKVLLQCTLVTFRRNQKIYCQGEVAKEVYFIKTGEVKISRVIELPERPESEANGIESYNGLYKFNHHPNSRTVDLAILTTHEHFGEEDIVFDQKRQASACCISQTAEIYVLSKKEFFRRVFFDESAKSFLRSHWKWKNQLYSKRITEIIGTTLNNKELLLRQKPTMNVNLLEFVKNLPVDHERSKSPELSHEDRNTKRERIATARTAADTEEEKELYAGFTNCVSLAGLKKELDPKFQQRIALLRETIIQQGIIDPAQVERHKKYAIKKVRPRHYTPFVPEGRPRTPLLNFGVPITIRKTSPMVIALQKQRNRDHFMRKGKQGNKASNNTSAALLNTEEALTSEPKRTRSVDPNESETAPMRAVTRSSLGTAKKLNVDYSFVKGKEPMGDLKQGADKIKGMIMKNVSKVFKGEKVFGRTMSDWVHTKRDEVQSKLATEYTPEKGSFYVGKQAPLEVYIRDSRPFKGLPKHTVKTSHGTRSKQNQNDANKAKERANTVGDESENMNKSTTAFLNSTQTLITQRIGTQMTTAEDDDDVSEANNSIQRLNTEGRERAGSALPTSIGLSARPFGPVKEFKPKFSNHSLKLREFRQEMEQVKSFVGYKRLGTE